MSCEGDHACTICGGAIDHKDLYEDLDKLGNTWVFHLTCFNHFNNKDYKKKVK